MEKVGLIWGMEKAFQPGCPKQNVRIYSMDVCAYLGGELRKAARYMLGWVTQTTNKHKRQWDYLTF